VAALPQAEKALCCIAKGADTDALHALGLPRTWNMAVNEHWQKSGRDPDYRYSLANERTFLAWIRTALAILAGAILLHQVQTGIHPIRLSAIGSGCVAVISAAISMGAYHRWRSNEIAMRHEKSLPSAILIPFMSALVGLVGVGAAVVLLLHG
jgi:putative membrane protein